MLEWLENYVKGLVRQPDQVSVSTREGTMVVQVDLKVATDDLALFDGRHNRLTRALGSTLALKGARSRRRYVLTVVD